MSEDNYPIKNEKIILVGKRGRPRGFELVAIWNTYFLIFGKKHPDEIALIKEYESRKKDH